MMFGTVALPVNRDRSSFGLSSLEVFEAMTIVLISVVAHLCTSVESGTKRISPLEPV